MFVFLSEGVFSFSGLIFETFKKIIDRKKTCNVLMIYLLFVVGLRFFAPLCVFFLLLLFVFLFLAVCVFVFVSRILEKCK